MKNFLNKSDIQLNRNEISGALGDVGTFLPLALGLAVQCDMNLGLIFLWAGLAYISAGFVFKIPMPVQPMKIIAAIAIAEGIHKDTIIAAGLVMGAVMLILGAAKLTDWFYRIIPRNVIRGLQLAVGLKLLYKGFEFMVSSGFSLKPDSIYAAIFCIVLVLLFFKFDKIPGALVIFLLGTGIAVWAFQDRLLIPDFGGTLPIFQFPSMSSFKTAIPDLALPQMPLTILNSVVAVCLLSRDFFPEKPLSPGKVAMSIGAINLIACPLGGMPMCHGAGGLASHYRFGARTAGSVISIGAAMILVSILFGKTLVPFVTAYPYSVLGVLLFFSGWQLIFVCRDMTALPDIAVLIITAGFCILWGTAYGFLAGFAVSLILIKALASVRRP